MKPCASAAKAGCEGSVSSAPDIQIFFEPGDADLTFRVRASEDTTLLINTPNGRFYCDDDGAGGVPHRVQRAPQGRGVPAATVCHQLQRDHGAPSACLEGGTTTSRPHGIELTQLHHALGDAMTDVLAGGRS